MFGNTQSGYSKGTPIGPYSLVRRLSDRGGMAGVYEAEVIDQHNPNRHGNRVAIKIALPNQRYSQIFENLLLEETNLLRDLRHPGIVRIYPFELFGRRRYYGRADELDPGNPPWYFAMELLPGGTLSEVIDNRRFGMEWRLELLYQITTILDYLHLRDIAHRDLKPDNIMFREKPDPNKTPVPVLIDFGLSQKRAYKGVEAATLTHAAPERVQHFLHPNGRATEPNYDYFPSDIWALGIIAYEVVNLGRHPFANKRMSQSELAYRISHDQPPPMENYVPPKIQQLIHRMLHKDRDYRPHKLEQIIDDLETAEIIAPRLRH